MESFQSAVAGLEAVGSASAIELISVFQRSRKHALKAFQSGDINNLSQLRSEAEGLNKYLLHLEMKTNEQIEELFEILETSLNELRLAKLTIHQGFFRSMEAFEGRCNDPLLVIAEQIIKLGAEDSSAFEHLTDDLNLVRTAIDVCA